MDINSALQLGMIWPIIGKLYAAACMHSADLRGDRFTEIGNRPQIAPKESDS